MLFLHITKNMPKNIENKPKTFRKLKKNFMINEVLRVKNAKYY